MQTVTLLSLGRIGVGVASLLAPGLVTGVVTPGQPEATTPLMTQWFGSREIAVGAATLLSRGGARRTMVLLGMAVDGADAATAYAAIERKEIPKASGLGTVAIAAGAVVAGALGLRVKKKTRLDVVAA